MRSLGIYHEEALLGELITDRLKVATPTENLGQDYDRLLACTHGVDLQVVDLKLRALRSVTCGPITAPSQ